MGNHWVNGHRWTQDDEDEYQAELAHEEHDRVKDYAYCDHCETEYRATHPENFGDCLCDVADAPEHEDYNMEVTA